MTRTEPRAISKAVVAIILVTAVSHRSTPRMAGRASRAGREDKSSCEEDADQDVARRKAREHQEIDRGKPCDAKQRADHHDLARTAAAASLSATSGSGHRPMDRIATPSVSGTTWWRHELEVAASLPFGRHCSNW